MIHKYKLNGFNIVLDVNSGGVHLVDDMTYDLLDLIEPPFEDECPQQVLDKLTDNIPLTKLTPAMTRSWSFTTTRSSFPRMITRSTQSIPLLLL